ncbi:MAG: hypothetical protein JXL80_17255 [Planctomycetes bacterium]|nr:hypothetical protein [Planctomycetota bacterium]
MAKRSAASAGAASPAARYLDLVQSRVRSIRADIPHLTTVGEKMAAPMLAGGRLFTPSVAKFWPSEIGGRAGGFMGIVREPGLRPSKKTDVAYIALPGPRGYDPRKDEKLMQMMRSKAQIFVNGREDELEVLGSACRVAAFTGGAKADEGLYGLGDLRPLAGLRHFDQFVRGWMTTGEMITACIRAGRMPTIYMSVWLEGALARNSSFVEHHNLSEPWFAPFFHRDVYIPPLPPGYAAGSFLDIAEGHLKTLQGQLPLLAKAGQWMAEAKQAGRRIWVVAVGHSYPTILERPEDGSYPVEWGYSFSDLRKALPRTLRSGDVAVHLGYAPVNVQAIQAILKRGIRLVHSSPYGRPASLADHKDFIWLDLPWRPADASVDVPGYGARILPMSSTCHTMAYFALVAEMAEAMGWK